MNIRRISPKTLQIACLVLSDSLPELTEAHLAGALRAYDPNGRRSDAPIVGQALTLQDVADRLQISEKSVRRLITNGKLRALKLGTGDQRRIIRVSETALLDYQREAGG